MLQLCRTLLLVSGLVFLRPVHGADDTPARPNDRFEIGIVGGVVIDGSGAPRREANVYVRDGKIAEVLPREEVRAADTVIHAEGMVVTPGFIDTHAHGDPLRTPEFANFLMMGASTLCLGQDGDSPADPVNWLRRMQRVELGPNLALFAGHGTARNELGMGIQPHPSPTQIAALQSWVRTAMEHGCFGLTTGLEYQPGSFADLDELIAIARPVAESGGLVMSHLRSEDDDAIAAALEELLEQGQRSGCPVHVSHFKITYGHGRSRAEEVLQQLDTARQKGLRVTADIYPYEASYTGIGIVFPDWAKPPHDYRQVVTTRRNELASYLRRRVALRNGPEATLLATPPWTGKTLAEVADQLKKPFEEVLIDDIGLDGAKAAYFVMDAPLQERLMLDRHVMFCSDGGPELRHPRSFGTFARVIRDYVVERELLSLEEAVWKMSGLPAETLGLDRQRRGLIAPGFAADLLVFDPNKVRDHATYEDPEQFATGFLYVIVNGQVTIADGKLTGVRAGQVVRHREGRDE